MTTNSFINRYRPRTLDEVVGHKPVIDSLRAKIASPGDAYCYLMGGDPGSGKTTLAMIMAKAFNCEEIIEVDGVIKSGVDDMRDLIDQVRYPPLSQDNRAIIINEAHNLSTKAWDALLVTMEAGHPFNYWFLTTTLMAKVPRAVQQRCHICKLGQVSMPDLEDLLIEIVKAEKKDPPKDTEYLCAKAANGSPREAIANLSLVIDCTKVEDIEALLSETLGDAEAIELAKAIIGNYGWKKQLELLNRFDAAKIESVRYTINNYISKMIMGDEGDKPEPYLSYLFNVLQAFKDPFPTGEGFAPILRAIDNVNRLPAF